MSLNPRRFRLSFLLKDKADCRQVEKFPCYLQKGNKRAEQERFRVDALDNRFFLIRREVRRSFQQL